MEKIDFIKKTINFLNYNDYLKIYNELDDEKIKLIINNYKELIKNSLNININDHFRNLKLIRLEMLRFWKDFFCLFYLAVYFIKEYYKSNSIIISLGESPAKLVFTQSLFYNDCDIYDKLKLKNYPINLNFKYLPLSQLSTLLLTYSNGDRLRPFTEIIEKMVGSSEPRSYDYDYTFKFMNSNYNDTIQNNFKNYIFNADLDPLKIINLDKNIIIIDRTEGMTTLATIFYLYTKLTTFQKLTSAQKNIFFCKFNFIGFDFNINSVDIINQNTKIINNVKSFIKNLLEIDDIIIEKMIKIKILGFDYCKREEINNYIKQKEYEKFYKGSLINLGSAYNTLTLINFLTIPENYFLSSRCIKSYSLNNTLPDNLLSEFKQTDIKSVNCNFINFIIFLIFMKLKKTDEFDKLMDNIDNIHEYSFYKDTKTDIPIDKFLESLANRKNFIDFFIDDPQILSKTIFNDQITFSYDEIFNKDNLNNKYLKYKNKYLKYKYKYLKYKNKYLFTDD